MFGVERSAFSSPSSGDCFSSAFVRPNSDCFFDFGHKNFAVPDLAGLGRLQDRFDDTLRAIVGHHDFEFYFRQEIDGVFAAPINFTVAFLPPETAHFAQSHSLDPDSGKRVLHRLGFKWFNDRLDLLHRAKLTMILKAESGKSETLLAPDELLTETNELISIFITMVTRSKVRRWESSDFSFPLSVFGLSLPRYAPSFEFEQLTLRE